MAAPSTPSTDYWYLALNEGREPYDDVNVRRAVAFALDREAITKAAKFGQATANQTAIPQGSSWYYDYSPYRHDPDQARGQHPPPDRRCGSDAEHEDEERVDLAVEPAPERRDRAGAPGHPAVDGVESEGRDAEREQGRCHRLPGQELDGEGRGRAGEQRPA